jgi:hypothetical protein
MGALLWWRQQPEPVLVAPVAPDDIQAFLQRHWQVPIPPQGSPPAAYSPLEASLHPKDCGLCHTQQFQDWRTSVHSRSMGPGVYAQMLDLEDSNPATYRLCATCHTPLSEQIPSLLSGQREHPNAAFDADLQQAGLVCAACHVRQHQRFGPPRRPDAPEPPPGTILPHGGFTATTAFQRSEFCKGCHQFNADDFALNGKLIENTYAEWHASPYATEGTQCQDCHMPDRRHLWRGIHDPKMVQQAMTVALSTDTVVYKAGEAAQATVTITNSGAGHYLPTYVTPKIFVEAFLLDAQGQTIPDTTQQLAIGREVALDLSEELYDTRIPPKGTQAFTYQAVPPAIATTLRVRVVVHPDHFYQRFFEAVLRDGGGGKGHSQMQEALQAAEASPFTVFERDVPLRLAN